MKIFNRRAVVVMACSAAALLMASSLASAQMREFTGRIDRVSKKKMIVDNRMGDKVSFVPIETTEVVGEGKETSFLGLLQGFGDLTAIGETDANGNFRVTGAVDGVSLLPAGAARAGDRAELRRQRLDYQTASHRLLPAAR